MADKNIPIEINLNGEKRNLSVKANQSLLDVLRNLLGLTGTKYGCGKGECGTCTVLIDGEAVPSCLILAADVDGKEILTIEGLSKAGEMSPILEAFIEEGGFQCGFCTPGMILTAKALLDENPNPTEEEIREYMMGNLCRCTGYNSVVKSILAAAEKLRKR